MILDKLNNGEPVSYDRLLEYLYDNKVDAIILKCEEYEQDIYVELYIPSLEITITSNGVTAIKST